MFLIQFCKQLRFVFEVRCIYLAVMLSILGAFPAEAQRRVAIQAELDGISYKLKDLASARHPIHNHRVVKCIVSTNDWEITILDANDTPHWWFDNMALYNQVTLTNGSSSVFIWNSSNGCPNEDQWVNLPWLAFCSGDYLRRPGRLVPFVVVGLKHSPDGFAFSDATEVFDDRLGLPRSIRLYASDALFAKSVMHGVFEGKHDVDYWKHGDMGFKWNLPDDTLRFHYQVTQSTNFGGWNLPLRFEWFLNEPGRNGQPIPLGYATVTSISNASQLRPAIDSSLHPSVVDFRVGVVKGS